MCMTPENLTEMIALIADGTISSKIAKKVFVHLAKNGGSAKEYVQKAGLIQISDPAQLLPVIQQVFADNEKAINDYKGGNKNAAKSLIGQLMKATKGQANPQVAQKLLNGDEFGNSQNGNNNAYTQDNDTTWLDWDWLYNGV